MSSTWMVFKALSVPKIYPISQWAFFDASRVLTWISSAKVESSISGIFIFATVEHVSLSLVADLKDFCEIGGINQVNVRKASIE